MEEFQHLCQGLITVDQYEAKFVKLSQYAPRLVEHLKDRTRRFKNGLQSELKNLLVPLNLKNYNELLAQGASCLDTIVEEPKVESIVVVQKFSNAFLEESSDLLLERKIEFVIMFFDDILVYSRSLEEHEKHLRIVLQILRNHELYAKFNKCEFLLTRVAFLDHVILGEGIFVDSTKIEAVINWLRPTVMTKIINFMGLAVIIEGSWNDSQH
ncbi:uncharacterized protein LOC120293727 [Eucalyptus grandis]|uniref:uncharacterized protein LOC120293727 n=1 Tax=Eucalyptus grandis TaxID=71139 RepID=UPI00192E77ED|nr:uncharacterized protein LOC120293727 [Eucalyptus grandis]